jgi:pathogenesis-related protein 1
MRPALACSLLLLAALGCGSSEEAEPPGTPEDGLSELARDMLSEHNRVRATPNPTPTPALPPLTWSEDAAQKAQAWADRCRFEHNPNRGNLGENISAATPGGLNNLGVVRNWASEAPNFDYARNACAPGKVCGHYTQIVWRNTTQVGCAVKECSQNSPFQGFTRWNFWVCNYAPPGNFVGQRPY